jgi:virginiamycin B lyase
MSTTGQFKEYSTPNPRTFPEAITKGPDGALWFVEPDPNNSIGRVTTQGRFTEYKIPTAKSIPNEITNGPDGAIWFTEAGKEIKGASKVGRVTTTGEFTEFNVPNADRDLFGITTGSDGALWFCENAGNKVARMTTSGSITEYVTPTVKTKITNGVIFGSSPTYITAGPANTIWFTENEVNKVGVLRRTAGN